jgi:hypothetical protein
MKKFITLLCLVSLTSFAEGNPCQGITAKKLPCSRTVKEGSYCFQHSPTAYHCGENTKSNQPCKRVVKVQGSKCGSHSK